MIAEFERQSCAVFGWIRCEECSGSFFCIYVKVVVGCPFVNFVEIWLYELLGLVVLGMTCCDCDVISVCGELYVFWRVWNVRGINVEESGRQDSALWYTSVDALEFRMCVVVFRACLSSFDVVCNEFDDRVWNVCKCKFLNKVVNVHCVKGFAHIEGDSNSALWRFDVVETTGNVMTYIM